MSDASQAINARFDFARRIADEAGQLTLQHFRSDKLAVERKSDDSPVTVADRDAELLMRQRIEEEFGSDGILGEEFPEKLGTSGYRWVLDPIDGTKSFVAGVPLYGTLVAVMADEQSLLGVINIPALGESVYAARGKGAWYVRGSQPPCPARVSPTDKLSDGLFLTSEVKSFYDRNCPDVFEQLQGAAKVTRTWGDCYGYLLVATGRAELMVDPEFSLWDAAALKPIIEEAGGTFTDWEGRPTVHAGEGVATNGRILEEALAIVRGR